MHTYSNCDGDRTKALGAIAVVSVVLALAMTALTARLTVIPVWLLSSPTLAGSFGLVYLWMDRLAWRWKALHWLGLVETPVIAGAYEGHLTSTYGPATARPVRLSIDQTWTKIAVRFHIAAPESSTSYSASAGLVADGSGRARLTYTYRNEIRPGIADSDMNDHAGTADIDFHPDGTAIGRYYNFRGRKGTLTLRPIQSP